MLTGTQDTGFNFSIYTGDLVSHDPDNELSREYVMYTEVRFHLYAKCDAVDESFQKTVLYDLFRQMLGSGPMYVALGNHDSHNECVYDLYCSSIY